MWEFLGVVFGAIVSIAASVGTVVWVELNLGVVTGGYEDRMNEQHIHRIFEVSVLLKGAHAVIECVGGLALAFVSTTSIAGWVNRFTQDELIEDPHDFVATHLLSMAQGFSVIQRISIASTC